jgi:hypothetical protein
LKEAGLEVHSAFGTVAFAIDKSTGHLLGAGEEYKRIK